jgi:hypothetical protein
MPPPESIPYEVTSLIISEVVLDLIRQLEADDWGTYSPLWHFVAFRSLLLTSRQINQIATEKSQLRIGGVDMGCYFQRAQYRLISNIANYAQIIEDTQPDDGFDFQVIFLALGQFWKNPLVFQDLLLVKRFLSIFPQDVSIRLLCFMGEFIDANAKIIEGRAGEEAPVWVSHEAKPAHISAKNTLPIYRCDWTDDSEGPSIYRWCKVDLTKGNRQILGVYQRFCNIASINIEPHLITEPLSPIDRLMRWMRANPDITDWWLVESREYNRLLGKMETEWYLINYKAPMFFSHDGEFRLGVRELALFEM